MRALRFGPFRLDVTSNELRRQSRLVKLGPQPLRLLTLLASRAGELVTREQLHAHLWADGTSVDFEHGVNACVRQVRRALGDRPGRPRFIETLPRRGYRFVADVTREAGAGRSKSSGRPARPVVGRAPVLAALAAAWQRAVDTGSGVVVCVSGEPGVGKTTVAETFITGLLGRPGAPLVGLGRCSERLAGTEAYLPWLEALEDLVDDASGEADSLLRSVAPAWYGQVTRDGSSAASRGGPQSQEQLKRELVAFFRAASTRRPLLVWLEDLHWADASTVDLIAYVADRLDGLPVLLLTTYRDTELLLGRHPFVSVRLHLQARGIVVDVPVPLLGLEDVRSYLDAEMPHHNLPDVVIGAIHRRTEGSPLFVTDAVDYLRSTQTIVPVKGGWALVGRLSEFEHDLPDSTKAMIDRKLGLLDDADTALLRTASVQGVEFLSTVVADAAGRDALDVEEALAGLAGVHRVINAGNEHRLPDGTLAIQYQFVHVLYQNVLCAQLSPSTREALSLRSAEALATHHPEGDPAVAATLGRLYEAGGDALRACDQYLLAGRRALGLFANHEAVALGHAVLALLPRLRDGTERASRELGAWMIIATGLTSLRGWAAGEVGDAFSRAQELCERSSDRPSVVVPLFGLSAFHIVRGRPRDALRLVERIRPVADASGDSLLESRVRGDLGNCQLLLGQLAEARKHFEDCISLYNPVDHNERMVRLFGMLTGPIAMGYLASVRQIQGDDREADRLLEEAIRTASVHPFTSTAVLALASVFGAMVANSAATVRRHADPTIAIAEQHGFVGQVAFGSFFQGWAAAMNGAYEHGLNLMQRSEETLLAVGNDLFESSRRLALAAAHRQHGALERAAEALDEAEAFIEAREERIFAAEAHRLQGVLAFDTGDLSRAERRFCQALEVAQGQGAIIFARRAESALARLAQAASGSVSLRTERPTRASKA